MDNEGFMTFIFSEEEITWKQTLMELVRTEKMDPWDIDISILAGKFLDVINKLQQLDFRITGKMVLAAAVLLRLKSVRLIGADLEELDRLIAGETMTEEEFYDELEQSQKTKPGAAPWEGQPLIPRTPQPRQRKVSIYDLVNALERALEVKKRRIMNSIPSYHHEVPEQSVQISLIIKNLYDTITTHFEKNQGQQLTFSMLIPGETKRDKIYTFIPLLHLSHQQKVELQQDKPFAEITIFLKGMQAHTEQETKIATT